MHANCLRDWKRLSKLQPMRLIPIFRVDQRRKAQQVLFNRNEEHAVRNSNVIYRAGRGRRAIRARPVPILISPVTKVLCLIMREGWSEPICR
jgi:hypothetical protein